MNSYFYFWSIYFQVVYSIIKTQTQCRVPVITGMLRVDILEKASSIGSLSLKWEGQEPHPHDKCPTEPLTEIPPTERSFFMEAVTTPTTAALFSLLAYSLPSSWNLGSFPGHWARFSLIFVYCYYLQHPSFYFEAGALKLYYYIHIMWS